MPIAFGLVKNPAFVDGNTRIAFAAAGEIKESQYAAWLKANARRGV